MGSTKDEHQTNYQSFRVDSIPNTDVRRRDFLMLMLGVGMMPAFAGFEKAMPRFSGQNVGETMNNLNLETYWVEEDIEAILLPIRKDYFYDRTRDMTRTRIPKGFMITLAKGDAQESSIIDGYHAALMGNVTGSSSALVALCKSEGVRLDGSTDFSPILSKVDKGGDYSFIGEVYPNKILNLLRGSQKIASFLEGNGPFEPGKTYSLLSILNIMDGSFYPGKNSAGRIVPAGGVCGCATTFARSLFAASGYTDKHFVERHMHPSHSRYFTGPGNPLISYGNSDVAIEVGDKRDYDFLFTVPEGLYLDIKAEVIPSGKPISDPLKDPDALLMLNYSWSEEKPSYRKVRASLDFSLNDYHTYRNQRHTLKEVSTIAVESDSVESSITQVVWPETSTNSFNEKLAKDSDLALIGSLVETLDSIISDWDKKRRIGSILRESRWHDQLSHNQAERIEPGLRMLDNLTFRVKDEPIQCVAWVSFLSYLDSACSPKNIGGQNRPTARSYIPSALIEGSNTRISREGIDYLVIDGIDDIFPGDLFFNYDTQTGHVGAVIAKNNKGLLVSDSNRLQDGRPRLFQVTSQNYRAVFGETPYKVIVGR